MAGYPSGGGQGGGGNVLAQYGPAILGSLLGFWNNRRGAQGTQAAGDQAAKTAMTGFNYLSGSPLGQQYLPAGGDAVAQQRALLGLGGDPAAAQNAFANYQNSTGFQNQLKTGQQAITSNRAAAGLLGSGSTLKALTRFGQDHAANSFSNYFSQLGQLSGMGLDAGGAIGNAASAGALAGADYQYGANNAANDQRGAGWDNIFSGLGQIFDIWNARRNGGGYKGKTPLSLPNGGGAGIPIPQNAGVLKGYA